MSPTAPTHASATQLLSSLADLSSAQRTTRLALYARDHAGTPHLAGILRQLETGGHGYLAVHMATAARDTAALTRYLSGPDTAVRRCALRGVGLVPDDAVTPLLDDAPTGLRRALYRTLYHGRRTALADGLLARVRDEYGDAEAAALLPACSPERVADHLPGLAHAVRSWRRLARRHSDVVLDLVRREDADQIRWSPLWRALQALDPVRPQEVAGALKERDLNRLTFPHAHRARHGEGGPHHYPVHYPALRGGDRSVRLLRRSMRFDKASVLKVLRAMPPETRQAHIDRFRSTAGARSATALLPYLELLSPEEAAREARRALDWMGGFQVRSTRTDPNADLDAVAFLPYAEAAPRLEDAASSGDTDRRARGLSRLVEATARTGDADRLARVLTERVERTRAERDPVRRALIRALCGVHPVLMARAGLATPDGSDAAPDDGRPLVRLLTAAVEARDCSADTRRALRDLAARVLRHPRTAADPAASGWGLDVYARLMERFGVQGLGKWGRPEHAPPWWCLRGRRRQDVAERYLDQVLPPGREHDLYRRLRPALDAEKARGAHALAVRLAWELGDRAEHLRDLADNYLVPAVLHDPESGTALWAARWYLAHPDRARRAHGLLDADPATARIPAVWEVLARDAAPAVLERVLDAAEEHRRAEGRVWVPPIPPRAARAWPDRVRDRVAAHLEALAADSDRTPDERESAIAELGTLPGTLDRLAPFAASPDVVLREAALRALGRCDAPERALERILEHADGPQSRAAGPALGRCAQRVPPSRLGPVLARVLDGPAKITLRKSAARLLEHHRPPGGVGHLARVLAVPGLHRDVRAAVAGSLMRAADHPEAVRALAAHADGFTDLETQTAVLQVPPRVCPPDRRRQAAAVVSALPAPERHHWRLAGWTARWAPWSDRNVDEIVDAACDLDVPGLQAVSAFEALVHSGSARDRVAEVAVRLIDAVPGPDEGIPRRLPVGERGEAAARLVRVLDLIEAVTARQDSGGDEGVSLQAGRVLDHLAARPELAPEAVRVVANGIHRRVRAGGEEEAAPTWQWLSVRLLTGARLLARCPRRTEVFVNVLVDPVHGRYGGDERVPADVLERTVSRLLQRSKAGSGGEGVMRGLVALEIIERCGRSAGWAGPWPDLLTRAGETGHEAVRLAAWRLAVM
ncbi:hypothetical protein [Nocardiopsis aegyptia]|uniref:HEAT repeat domain-containing protein n=1 Tax=Nocardiopsis aegyptia TaxID=220378 RepID=A0A7Z0EK39_9ACTN|nr:hypothetical protein [Nocardiopsis aegyptia]NYJ33081.1 hypothetical protein [Nocardiopsis aegyptia]